MIETIESDRLATDSPSATGALVGDGSGTVPARVSYAASYYDQADRDVADVNVGTNDGTAWTRPSSVPSDSASVLVTAYTYSLAGELATAIDPDNETTAYTYDAAGRLIEQVADETGDGVPTDSSNQTTTYTYDGDDNLTSETAVMPSGEASQTTDYVYGVSTATGSAIDDNDLLYQVQYPDPATGATSGSSGTVETYTYDALGDTLTYTDRNGTTHAYSYDALDRLTADTITHFGPGVDQTVAKIGFSYNDAGDLQDATSYDGSGNVLNQVQESYDGEGNIVGDAQSHSGAVGSSTPSVNYSYNQSTGELESMEYPNGRTLDYGYTSVGQVSSISDGSGTLASYGYLGLDTPLSTLFGNGVTETTTLDTFGRIAEQKYVNSSGTDLDDISYGYDNDGNVLYEQNNVLSGQSELFTYDGLNRLTNAETGTLNSSHTGMTSTSNSESWSLDALGNWKSSTTNGTTTSRTNNAQNEVTTIGSATLAYDADGNTLTDQSGQQYVYDAWNRLVAVKNASGQTIAAYGYDALGRRITQTENGVTTDLYYSTNWQVVEERQSGSTTTQYVWSPFYVDQLIERYDQPNGNGQLTRRLYAQQDADYNVTSITDNSGNVVERYSYDPYGNVTVENPDGSVKGNGSASASGYNWRVLHQGLMLDGVTGTYDERNRQYDPTSGRFLQQDPAKTINGLNLYQLEIARPLDFVDPLGADAIITLTNGTTIDTGATSTMFDAWLALLPPGSISNISITGHGNADDEMVWLGDSNGWFSGPWPGEWLPGRESGLMNDQKDFLLMQTDAHGNQTILDGNGDITPVLNQKLAPKGTLVLNACNSDQFAKDASLALPGHPVTGIKGPAKRFEKNGVLGLANTYINGAPPPMPNPPPLPIFPPGGLTK